MRSKKVIGTVASLILAMGLTACGGSGGNSASPSSSATGKDVSASPSAAASAKPAEKQGTPDMDFDMGGRTIKIVSWWDMTIKEDNPDNIQKKKNLDALMKKHNFKVQFIALDFGEYQKKVTASLLAGEPLGDMIRLGKNYTIPSLVKQELLWPLDEYTKNSKALNPKANQYMTYNGKTYGFTEQGNLITGIFYNRTLMNKLGLKPLQEYVNSDTWNWDTFIQVAKGANKDTNNDGKLDTWGLAQGGVMDAALVSNETSLTKEDKQNLDDPKTGEVFKFLSRIATEKVARPTEGGDWKEPSQFFRQGNTLMYAGAWYELDGIQKDMKDYDIGFLPFPKGPSATGYHAVEGAFQTLAIPKKVEHPEQLVYIWEKINDINSMYDYPDQAELEKRLKDPNDIKNARTAGDGMIVLDHGTFMPKMPYFNIISDITKGDSASTVIEKYKAPVQASIDEVYKK